MTPINVVYSFDYKKNDISYNNIRQNTSFIAKNDNCRSRFIAERDISISANHTTDCGNVINNGYTHGYYFEVVFQETNNNYRLVLCSIYEKLNLLILSSTCRKQKPDKSNSARENEKKSHHDSSAKKIYDVTSGSSDPCPLNTRHMHTINCIRLQI